MNTLVFVLLPINKIWATEAGFSVTIHNLDDPHLPLRHGGGGTGDSTAEPVWP